MIINMRDDSEACRALLRLGQELQWSELDGGVSRDSFWGSIADRFNDLSVLATFSFTGYVDEADPSRPPLCRREASCLKNHFQNSRPVFTVA